MCIAFGGISDIIEGIKDGKIRCGAGHISQTKDYWKRPGAVEKEAFAHMYEAAMTNPDAVAAIARVFPRAQKIFEEMLNGKNIRWTANNQPRIIAYKNVVATIVGLKLRRILANIPITIRHLLKRKNRIWKNAKSNYSYESITKGSSRMGKRGITSPDTSIEILGAELYHPTSKKIADPNGTGYIRIKARIKKEE